MRGSPPAKLRRLWPLLMVPLLAAAALVVRRVDRVQAGPDAGVFVGLVSNLRSSGALTSLTDQFWIRLSPAATVARLGDVPVADFGPLYPAVVAAVPASVDVAFLVIHVLALFAAVLAVGLITRRATDSTLAAVSAGSIAIWGPSSPQLFFPDDRPLDLFARIGADGPAVAWWLLGFAVVVGAMSRCDRPRSRRWIGAATTALLLAAAVLTRYALVGAVAGLLVALLLARWRKGDRRWPPVAAAMTLPLLWPVLIYPVVVGGAGPKSLAWHPGGLAPIGTTMGGWFGLDVAGGVGVAVVGAALLGFGVVCGLARAGGVASLAAASAAGQLAILVIGRFTLDAGLNVREERHLLLVRFLLAILVVCGLHALAVRVTANASDIVRRAAPGVIAVGLALLVGVTSGVLPIPRPLRPLEPPLAVEAWLADRGDPPVLSNNSEDWFVRTGVPAADLPRTIEPSTSAPRDVTAELAELATVAPVVVQAYRPGFFESVDLRTVPCAATTEVWTARPEVLGGFELAVVDLTRCGPR
ncbi:MAG: hypothetical protein ACR2HQ_11400 [Ilumatobacteraceae bacterium]